MTRFLPIASAAARRLPLALAAFQWFATAGAAAAPAAPVIPPACRQLVVGIARNWDDSHVVLQRFERTHQGWRPAGSPWAGRLGRSGLSWGRGLHPVPPGARMKVEGDGTAPAGLFAIGQAYGLYLPEQVARPRGLPYLRIGPRDLWVEDPASPHYNRHLTIPHPEPRTPWEKKQQMKLNDPAHALKIFVAHNAPPKVVPGGGSAIFFHIWRSDGKRPTTGCTTMPELRLRELAAWLDPARVPAFLLLPRAEYDARRSAWGLP
jgi:L,D-peptidoglycan transpeptidase YkuD (ErfK/YbiS/YcfS/YnhG family)